MTGLPLHLSKELTERNIEPYQFDMVDWAGNIIVGLKYGDAISRLWFWTLRQISSQRDIQH